MWNKDGEEIAWAMEYRWKKISIEYRLIGEIIKKVPQACEILERYFGKDCLNRPGFKILTLGMACILFDINQKRLLQEFKKV